MKLIILVGPLFFASCEQIWTVEDQRHLIKKKKDGGDLETMNV